MDTWPSAQLIILATALKVAPPFPAPLIFKSFTLCLGGLSRSLHNLQTCTLAHKVRSSPLTRRQAKDVKVAIREKHFLSQHCTALPADHLSASDALNVAVMQCEEVSEGKLLAVGACAALMRINLSLPTDSNQSEVNTACK